MSIIDILYQGWLKGGIPKTPLESKIFETPSELDLIGIKPLI